MIDQYVLYVNNLKTNTVEFGKTSKHEEDAINFIYEKAIDIVKSDSGERHLQFSNQIKEFNEFDIIKNNDKYPSGLYIKQNKHQIEIYEKKIKEPTFIYNMSKTVVWDYKFINKPSIKYVIENDKFPASNLYGFVISQTDIKYKILVKDTFKGTIYNYDDIKSMYEFNCDGFYMSRPDQFTQYYNGNIIYYINHEEESFIVELVKGIINVKEVDQCVDFNLVSIIGYNKITIDLPFTLNNKKNQSNQLTNGKLSDQLSNKLNSTLKITKSDHGNVFNQLGDVFKKYDIDSCTEQFRPSMLRQKKIADAKPKTKIIEKIIEKIVEKDIIELVELGSFRIGILAKLYFEYINDIEHDMIETLDNPSINKYITSLDDILNLNLSDIINLYKLVSERLSKIIKDKNIELDNNNKEILHQEPKKNIIKRKFKKPTRLYINGINDDFANANGELFNIYLHNKEIIDKFLIENNYNIFPLNNITEMNQFDINYWSRVLNFALKNVEIKYITIQEITKIYMKFTKSFDNYFIQNNIKLINNFQELLEWNELSYENICYITNVFICALKHVDITQNKIDIK